MIRRRAMDQDATDEDARGQNTVPPKCSTGRQWRSLVRRADFLRIAASGHRRATPGFILQAAACDLHGEHAARLGFTASRKVGNAVARNRAKRRLRALADRVAAQFDPALDYVLIGRVDVLTRNFALLEQDLRMALKRIAAMVKDGRGARRDAGVAE